MTPLASDPWPEVRRRAAQVLGDRCGRPGPAHALAVAIGRDPDLEVRGDALAALVQCKAPGAADVLAHVWNDTKLPSELRQRAVDLSVALGDRVLAQKLVALFATWRGGALASTEALALAQNAAYALGRLAPPGAADALLAALDDGAFPEIVAAAASGLGLLGPACPAPARSRSSARSDTARSSRSPSPPRTPPRNAANDSAFIPLTNASESDPGRGEADLCSSASALCALTCLVCWFQVARSFPVE